MKRLDPDQDGSSGIASRAQGAAGRRAARTDRLRLALGLGTALAATTALVRRKLMLITVDGASMEPTYRSGDRLLLRRSDGRRLRTGQVVVVTAPQSAEGWRPGARPAGYGPGNWLVKRAVAVAGEPVPSDVVAAAKVESGSLVPSGQLVVRGDGVRSGDSRLWGFVPVDQVLGVVLGRPLRGGGQ